MSAGSSPSDARSESKVNADSRIAKPEPNGTAKRSIEHVQPEDEFPFGDPTTFSCLLCMRKLKTLDLFKKHNVESALHKSNLEKPAAVADAIQKKAAMVAKKSAAVEKQHLEPERIALEDSNKRARVESSASVVNGLEASNAAQSSTSEAIPALGQVAEPAQAAPNVVQDLASLATLGTATGACGAKIVSDRLRRYDD